MAGCSSSNDHAEPTSLDGTAWVLASLAGAAPSKDDAPTARFQAGRVTGTDGCNRFTVPYTTRGAAIEFGARGAMTQMACAPDAMKRADAFMAALSGARSYRISGSELQLLAANGAVLSTFTAQTQSLAATSWRATGINNGRQALVSLIADSSVTLAFAADGKVSGSAGCNNFTSTYLVAGNTLRFTPAAATRRMCEAGVMEQEQAFLRALETVATMRMEGKRLELRTAEGALAVTLERSPGS